jgi:hypothetical protein
MNESIIKIITVPFDAAQFNKRMGAGPLNIIDNGLLEKIKAAGNEVVYIQIVSRKIFKPNSQRLLNCLH